MTNSNDSQDWRTIKKKILTSLDQKSLVVAMRNMRQLASMLDVHDFDSQIDNAEQTYRAMRRFAFNQANDPEREAILTRLIDSLYITADSISLRYLSRTSQSLFFSSMRGTAQSNFNLAKTCAAYASCEKNNHQRFNLLIEIFVYLWTKVPLDNDDMKIVANIVRRDDIIAPTVIAALMMSQLEYYDSNKTKALVDAYMNAGTAVAARALTAIVIVMSLYASTRARSASVINIIDSVADVSPKFARDLESIFSSLIRASDTERISKKMTDEILPDLMRIAPELRERMKNIDPDDLADPSENPEWLDMLEESGISDRLREISDLQEQGGDVMMGTFSNMKHFPFFSNMANWFVPFTDDYPEFTSVIASVSPIIKANPMLCDSDKWSMAFMLQKMPEGHLEMVKNQMEQQNIQIGEDVATSVLDSRNVIFDREVSHFIQDTYRFFKLFGSRNEAKDIFKANISPFSIDKFAKLLSSAPTLRSLANLYMTAQNFQTAAATLERIEDYEGTVADYQKCGYCHFKAGNIERASEMFYCADTIQPDNKWTVRQLAKCYERTGKYEEAYECFARLAEMEPENYKISWHKGVCGEVLKRYDEALQDYYKVLFYKEDSVDARLGLSSVLIAKNDLDKAFRYANEAVKLKSNRATLSQRAIVNCHLGNFEAAIDDFCEWFSGSDDDIANLRKALSRAEIDSVTANFIIDEVIDRT